MAILLSCSIGYALIWHSMGYINLVYFNIGFFCWYLLCCERLYKQRTLLAKDMLLFGFILHCFCYSNFFLDKHSGMHLYAIAIIPSSFLIYGDNERIHGILVSCAAVFMLWSTEVDLFNNAYYHLSDAQNNLALVSALVSTISGMILLKLVFDRTLRKHQLGLIHLSQHDALTSLFTRRVFMDYLKQRFSDNNQLPQSDYLLMIDVDDFKSVNDTYSHHIGDQVLINISHQLQLGLDDKDMLARFGGEEFAILLCDKSQLQVTEYCESLAKQLVDNPFRTADKLDVYRSVSVGACLIEGNFHKSLKTADERLYQAKHKGRNCYVIA